MQCSQLNVDVTYHPECITNLFLHKPIVLTNKNDQNQTTRYDYDDLSLSRTLNSISVFHQHHFHLSEILHE